ISGRYSLGSRFYSDATSDSSVSTVDDVRAQSCQGDHCGRLLRRGDGNISARLRAGDHGDWNAAHPSRQRDAASDGQMTLQQFRECVTGDEGYKFVIHDRDSIYSRELDSSLRTLGLGVLRTPYRSPQANAFCERLIGRARRECLDFMIPLDADHL